MSNKKITPKEYVDAVHGKSILEINTDKPVNGTKEWAGKNVNFQNCCVLGCKYCFAGADAVRRLRIEKGDRQIQTIRVKDVNKSYGKFKTQVMSPSTHRS